MDPLATVEQLSAFRGRGAGSDAERRAANWLAERLRKGRRDVRVEPLWVNPHAGAVYALHAALAAVGGLVAVAAPAAGLAIVAVTWVSLVLDLTGRAFLLRRLTPRRASQSVLAEPDPELELPVRLVLAAHYDAPRTGLARHPALRRTGARLRAALGGHLMGGLGALVVAVTLVGAAAALRVADVEGPGVGLLQFLPTVVLLGAIALGMGLALAPVGPGASDPGSGVAVALAVAEALEAHPPTALEVEVVLPGAGAGPGPQLGMRTHVRWLRRDRRREDIVVLGLGPCGRGRVRWLTREGALWPPLPHRRLAELCAQVAAEESHLGAAPGAGRMVTAAHAARAARCPAVGIACLDADGLAPGSGDPGDEPDRLDPRAMRDAVEFVLALVAQLDEEVARTRKRPGSDPGAPSREKERVELGNEALPDAGHPTPSTGGQPDG
jgi:hypothetical protein